MRAPDCASARPALLGLLAGLVLGLAAASQAGEPEHFYRDATGTVYLVSSRDELPPRVRASAERVEIGATPRPREREPRAASRDVSLYYASWCGWCRKTRAYLDARGVDYELRDVDRPAVLAELRSRTGSASVPVVDIGGRLIRGYSPEKMDLYLSER